MSQTTRQRLEQLLRIGRKWRWYGLIPSVLVTAGRLAYAVAVPTQYTASATLSVDQDSPTNPLLRDLNLDQRRQERLALGLGMGAGVAGVVARDYLDERYDDGDQLAAAFDLPCIAVLPRLDKVA